MLNVLIVDDEPRHRRGLVNIVRQLRPDFQIHEAMNGREALEVVRRSTAHIVITDIRMPVMDGFEFLAKADPERGNMKVVIITAYRDFEYAKKAIHFRVFDYILKPVEVEAVERTLRKVESAIVEELKERSRTERLVDKLNQTQSVFLEHQLNKELEGLLSPEERDRLAMWFNLKQPGFVLYVELIGKGRHPDTALHIYEQIRNWRGWGTCVPFFLQGSREQLAVLMSAEGADRDGCPDMDGFTAWLENWLRQMFEQTGCRMTIGIGEPCSDMSEQWVRGFRQARVNALKGFFRGHGAVYVPEKVSAIEGRDSNALLADFVSAMEQALREMNAGRAREVLAMFCERLPLIGGLSPERVKEAFKEALAGPVKQMRFLMEEEEAQQWEADMRVSLDHCSNLETARRQAEYRLADILQRMDKKHAHKMDHTMEACKAYIAENYMKDISLDDVAGRFHFNPSYFSNQFKHVTGVNFSEYLMRLRLDGAVRLLETTNKKVYEIARIVGYRDVKYFCRLFKKKMGTTPEQYRTLYVTNRARSERGNM